MATFACFVGYTVLINLIWAATLDNLSLIQSSLFYAHDTLLFVICVMLYSTFKERFLRTTVHAVAASVIVQALLSPLAPGSAFARQTNFFNDENQLGYFCVLSAIILVLGARRFFMRPWHQAVGYAAIGYLALISQCRSALSALAALAVISVLGRPWRLVVLAAVLLVAYLVVSIDPSIPAMFGDRFITEGEYDTLATRGYDRIVKYPEHLLFGSGEGAYSRFLSDLYGTEIHSSYGTLLFCYGLVGTGIFSAGLLLIFKTDPRSALYLVPAFVYGSAHHGLRFAFFWAMLAFVCCMALDAGAVRDVPESRLAAYPPPMDEQPGLRAVRLTAALCRYQENLTPDT